MKKYYNISFMISSIICIAWCIIGTLYTVRIDADDMLYSIILPSTVIFTLINCAIIAASKKTIICSKKTSNIMNVAASISLLNEDDNAINALNSEGKTISKKPLMTVMVMNALFLLMILYIEFDDKKDSMGNIIPFSTALLLLVIPLILIIFNIIITLVYNYSELPPKILYKETDLGTPLQSYDFITYVRIKPWKERVLERMLSYIGFVVLEFLFIILLFKTLSNGLLLLFWLLLMFLTFCALLYIHFKLYEKTVGYEKQFQVNIQFYNDRFRVIYPCMRREELYGARREVEEFEYKLIESAKYNKDTQCLSITGKITTTLFRLRKTRKDPSVFSKTNSYMEVSLHLGLLSDSHKFLNIFETLSKIKVI